MIYIITFSDFVIIPYDITYIYWGAFNYEWQIDAVYSETPYDSNTPNWVYNTVQNSYFNNAPKYFYSETYVDGCWHYVDGVPTLW